jgi:hypothetical protein
MNNSPSNLQFLSAALAQTFQGVGSALWFLSLPESEQSRHHSLQNIQGNPPAIQFLPAIQGHPQINQQASTAYIPELATTDLPLPATTEEAVNTQEEIFLADQALLQAGITSSLHNADHQQEESFATFLLGPATDWMLKKLNPPNRFSFSGDGGSSKRTISDSEIILSSFDVGSSINSTLPLSFGCNSIDMFVSDPSDDNTGPS